MKKVYFVRHGETEGNVGKYFQTPDTPLTLVGHEGAKATAERVRHLGIDTLLVSPFKRTQQTAEHICRALAVPMTTVESLHEIMQSVAIRGKEWASPEGLAYVQLQKEHFFEAGWDNGGAENHAEAITRIQEVVSLIENHPGEHILVVSHGQFLSLLFIYLLLGKNIDSSMHKVLYSTLHLLSNVAITEFRYDGANWQLFTYNDHAHFAE